MKRPQLNITIGDITDEIKLIKNEKKTKLFQLKSKRKAYTAPVGESGYRGVSVADKRYSIRWKARIKVNGKRYTIGNFETKEEAAKAYDEVAKSTYGQKAILNFPDE